jgi:large subunit ribosomal protein L4
MSKLVNISIVNSEGQPVREFALPAGVTSFKVSPALVHQVAVGYASNKRAGTAHTKNRAEVSGGGKKPWKQKGTGRARHGSIRSPLWKGGGVTFGPRNERNYIKRTPQQLKKKALSMVVADYLLSGQVIVVNEFPQADKTKVFATLFRSLKIKTGKRILVLLLDKEKNLRRGLSNLPSVEIMGVKQLNAYDGLSVQQWLVSEAGLAQLIKLVV